MKEIKALVRKNILQLKPYSSARDEYTGTDGIFLDANENPYGKWNRYPDPYQHAIKKELSQIKQIAVENIFIGNGSDEVIDLCFRIFCRPGIDTALSFNPSYGMYKVSANIHDIELLQVQLNSNFDIDLNKSKPYLKDDKIKLLFICSPNNPSGNIYSLEKILYILNNFKGIVILDEAYIDFADTDSLIPLIQKYNNLIVCQTLSKAWGLASARVGMAFSNPYMISLLQKVKAPYNVSQLNQDLALKTLKDIPKFKQNLSKIQSAKKALKKELLDLTCIKKIYPSQSNFFLVECENAIELYEALVKENIIIRQRHGQVTNCIRITVGQPEENRVLVNAIKQIDEKSTVYR